MPNSNLKTEDSIEQMIDNWEKATSDSESMLWALAWRIALIDPEPQRSKIRTTWTEKASTDTAQQTLRKAVNGAAKIIRLNGNKIPNQKVRNRIEKNGASYVGNHASRINADILTSKGSKVMDCLDPAKKKAKSKELIPSDAPTVETVGTLLGQLLVNATDVDPTLLIQNVVTMANNYVATVEAAKAKK